MLIIEGPDMIGKTTLIAQIASAVRDGRRDPPLTTEKYSFEEIMYMTPEEWIGRIRRRNIVDRFCQSALIYGPYVTHRKAGITALDHDRIMRQVRKRGGFLVVLHATESYYEYLLQQHYPARKELFSPEVCRAGNGAYAKIAASALCNYSILLDGAGFAMDIAADKIDRIVSTYMLRQAL